MLSFPLFLKFVPELLSVATVVEVMADDTTNNTRERFAICVVSRFAILITVIIAFMLLALLLPIFRLVLLFVIIEVFRLGIHRAFKTLMASLLTAKTTNNKIKSGCQISRNFIFRQ